MNSLLVSALIVVPGFVYGSLSTCRVPLIWSAATGRPKVLISVNNGTAEDLVDLSLLRQSMIRLRDEHATSHRLASATLESIGGCSVNVNIVAGVMNPNIHSRTSALNMHRSGPLNGVINSFMITPNNLVLNPSTTETDCTSELVEVKTMEEELHDRWNVYNYISEENFQPILLSINWGIMIRSDQFESFMAEIQHVAHGLGKRTTPIVHRRYMKIYDCDIDELDPVLPSLTYSFRTQDNTPVEIELSAREYLRPLSDNSTICIVEIHRDLGNAPLYLGAPLFRKYAVLFDYTNLSIKVCRANVAA